MAGTRQARTVVRRVPALKVRSECAGVGRSREPDVPRPEAEVGPEPVEAASGPGRRRPRRSRSLRRLRRRLRRELRAWVLRMFARGERAAGALVPRPKRGPRILDPLGEELKEQLQALLDLLLHRPLPRRPLLRAAASRALAASEAAGAFGFLPYLLNDLLRELSGEEPFDVRYFARQIHLAVDGIEDLARRVSRVVPPPLPPDLSPETAPPPAAEPTEAR